MRYSPIILVSCLLIAFGGCQNPEGGSGAATRVVDPKCEYLNNPMGIDVARPRLSWIMESRERGARQTAFQILVASSPDKLKEGQADLWDTGKVESDQSIHVAYNGVGLVSRARCWWKVRVWNEDGRVTGWSPVSFWEMGLLYGKDWDAKWISAPAVEPNVLDVQPSPFFRREFTIDKPIVQARAYICGLGYYELYLNGAKVGDHVLDPAFTRYDRRALYVTYDITSQLKQGDNAAGVVLGNGWYNMHTRAVWDFDKAPWRNRPTMLCRVEVLFADGTGQVIASGPEWKVSTGPIVFEGIRNGETYDARREMPGWCQARFDDSAWSNSVSVDGPAGALAAQMAPPIKVMNTIKPVSVNKPKPGVCVFDLGQNIAGWARLNVSAPAGTEIMLKYGERLNPDGTVDQTEIGKFIKQHRPQTDTYICKGDGVEVWETRFTYHGFQYVEVTGLPGEPSLDTLDGRVVHTSFEPAGAFSCSNDLLNRIQQNTLWSYVGNFHGYPTDCPHREKNGWTGDAHLAAEQGLLNFAPMAAYTKWMGDMYDEQRESGELPGIVPTSGWGYAWGNGPAWDSAYLLIPWYMYQYCGDVRILAVHYDRHKRYVDYLTSKAEDGIVGIGLGDWVPAKTKTPENVTSTGYYYRDTMIVAEEARLLGHPDDAKKYGDLAASIKEAFNKKFYDPDTGLYAGGTQTAMSCALYQGLVPEDQKQRVVDNLVKNIESQGGHLDAGILGTKYLLNCLTDAGRADMVYTIATQTDYPSWGRWIVEGHANTLWEQWNDEASHNHIMFGDISAWFYDCIAGINPDPQQPGYKHIIIRPWVLGDMTWAKAEHRCMYGTIRSEWKIEDGAFVLDVTVPANTTATIYVPTQTPESVTEGGLPVVNVRTVESIGTESGRAIFNVGAGSYSFKAELP